MAGLMTLGWLLLWYWCSKTTEEKGYGWQLGLLVGWIFPLAHIVILVLPERTVAEE